MNKITTPLAVCLMAVLFSSSINAQTWGFGQIGHWAQDVSIASDGNIRPALAGVRVTQTHLEATNSFVAVSIKNPFGELDAKHYPGSLKRTLSDGNIMIHKDEIALIPFKNSKKYAYLSDRAALVSNGEA